mmetsp:Transcript_7838/g.14126  ORF Transcript_7838/g.14126 Transcript_7838/m.14126 type:complete len:91 (-) Transcript_7838:275-547(-)
MTAVAKTAAQAAVRAGSRAMSDSAGPKLHRAKDAWKVIEATRPVSHAHLCFEPPYSPVTSAIMVGGILCIGYGSMYFGMRHQQYKQGYWK